MTEALCSECGTRSNATSIKTSASIRIRKILVLQVLKTRLVDFPVLESATPLLDKVFFLACDRSQSILDQAGQRRTPIACVSLYARNQVLINRDRELLFH